MSERWNVLLAEDVDPAGPASIADIADVTSPETYDDLDAMRADLDRYDAIVVRTFELWRTDFERAENLTLVSKHGIGLDNVDVEAASDHGVAVCNLPGVNPQAVAEHALTLLFAVQKRARPADADVRNGVWERSSYATRTIKGDTLGLFGFGDIGRRLAALADGVGMTCVTFDPYVTETDLPLYVRQVGTKADLFDAADAVSIHAPLTPETRGAIGRAELDRLPNAGVVVNTARGAIIDEDALVAALDDDSLAGAGLDVFRDEPPSGDDPLFDHENVVVTPHIAGTTVEARRRLSLGAARNVRRAYEGRIPPTTVNADAVSIGE